jgi:hypothetical protein
LARSLNITPIIRWPQNNVCEAEFKDIFEFNLPLFSVPPDNAVYVSDYDAAPINPATYSSEEQIINDLQTATTIYYSVKNIPQYAFNAKLYDHINTLLRFKQELVSTAEQLINQHTNGIGSYYGMHIRKTDNKKTINEDFYINLMQHNGKKKFFVCSDDKQTEDKFAALSNVFTYSKQNYPTKLNPYLDYSSENIYRYKHAIVDSIVDLIVLSKSMLINTTVESNFMKLAVLLNGYSLYSLDNPPPELHIGLVKSTTDQITE